jgi:hypothetical protein
MRMCTPVTLVRTQLNAAEAGASVELVRAVVGRGAQHVGALEARVGGQREHAARVGGPVHADVAAVAPRRRPRILQDEVRLTALLAPPHRQHRVLQHALLLRTEMFKHT